MDMLKTISTAFPNLTFQKDFELKTISYFKLGGTAELFTEVADATDLKAIHAYCNTHDIRLTMLGGISNVLIPDSGISGVCVRYIADTVTDLQQESEKQPESWLVDADAGVKNALLVSQTVKMGYEGLEYFLGVPGTLGGAVYNNSHYLGQLIGEHIESVRIITENSEFATLTNEECAFGYDSSRFHHTNEIILSARFALKKGIKENSLARIKEATEYRARTQPLGQASSGCIFQNVPNSPTLQALFPKFKDASHVPGGFIIDQAGLKGYTHGGVHVSEKHAAWIINDGSGSAQDVSELIEIIKKKVKEKFNIDLHEEIFYLQ